MSFLSLVLILLGLILLNGLFAMSEMALVSSRKSRLQKKIEEGSKGAKAAAELADDPSDFMSVVQIGITLVMMITGIFGEAALSEPVAAWLSQFSPLASHADTIASIGVVAMVTYVTIVLGELVPKRLGQIAPEAIAQVVARPLQGLTLLTRPLVHLLSSSTALVLRLMGVRDTKGPSVTQDEIHALLVEGSEGGVIDEQEHEMVRNVFRLDDRKIASLMVPRMDVVWLSLNDERAQLIDKITTSNYSRFPVCTNSINDVSGVVQAKDVLAQALTNQPIDLNSLMKPASYVPESLNGMELLNHLRNSSNEMAMVVDEYGDIQGIVTIQDVLEAITGEFSDPTDFEESWAVQRTDGSWLVDGLIPVHDLKDRLIIKALPDEERGLYNTLSGLMMLQLGRIPQVTDVVELANWRFEIVDMDGKRIDKVLASPVELDDSATDDTTL